MPIIVLALVLAVVPALVPCMCLLLVLPCVPAVVPCLLPVGVDVSCLWVVCEGGLWGCACACVGVWVLHVHVGMYGRLATGYRGRMHSYVYFSCVCMSYVSI